MEIAVLLIVLAVLLVLGVPVGISIAMGLVSVVFLFDTTTLAFLGQNLYSGLNSITLTAIPCFMLAGAIMEGGGLSKRLVEAANALVGNTYGALGSVTIVSCLFFGAISGSGPATVAAIGSIMIPYMVQNGYDRTYATALVAVAGGLGVIMPPSIPLIIYGSATNTSVGDLFLAGIGPAFLVAALLLVANNIMARKLGYAGNGIPFSMKRFLKAVWDGKWALIMPVIILGSIYGGVCTPTEAAVIAVMYGLLVGIFVYKEITFKKIVDLLSYNSSFVGGFMLTFAPAAALGGVLAMLQVPSGLQSAMLSVSSNKAVLLFIMTLMFIVIGMFVDTSAANLIFSPIMYAVMVPLGVNPVHLGLLITINLAIGFVTPPMAGNLFVASGMTKIPMEKIVSKAWPFIIACFISLLMVTYIPQISLFLVN